MFVDIGANLTHDDFNQDFDLVLDRAFNAGVGKIMVTGSSQKSSAEALALAQRYPGQLFATAGIHPHHAEETTPAVIDSLAQMLAQNEVKAVGETGLDFFRDLSPREIQVSSFESHIELAIEHKLPMFLHEREAYPRFAEILRAHRGRLNKVVVHCFTGEKEALHAYLDLGCHIGITGWICDERRGKHLLDIVGDIPTNQLMIETDAPYLLPRTIRPRPKSRRNEPSFLCYVCNTIAQVTGKSPEEIAASTKHNAEEFFDLC
ncbi:TatD family hydrolase [Pseudomonadales bacterium]|nr:TatD family hydrolase [Pseudomonadales bacterium]MDC0894618.1 TatD family hydrolase [Pseudomonadales bacterium]